MASGTKLEVLLDGLKFGEGPRWHDGKLWFSDFYAHRVATVDLDGRDETIVEVPQRPSGLGWTPKGELLVVSMLDRRVLRFDGKALHLYADLAALAGGLCNDMVVDAKGRAYVGNFGYDRHNNAPPRNTRIIRVDPDGRAASVGDEIHFPNGMVIAPDGRTLVVAETFAHRLGAFDVGADGALANYRVFAALDGVYPDGICLDAEGAVWVTDARGHDVLRVLPGRPDRAARQHRRAALVRLHARRPRPAHPVRDHQHQQRPGDGREDRRPDRDHPGRRARRRPAVR